MNELKTKDIGDEFMKTFQEVSRVCGFLQYDVLINIQNCFSFCSSISM